MAESWLGDAIGEFKSAKAPEKAMIIGIAVGVVALIVYLNRGKTDRSTPSASTGSTASSGGIPTVPGPNGSQIPILPTGLTPIYDKNGNLIGYQQGGSTGTGTAGTGGTGTSGYGPPHGPPIQPPGGGTVHPPGARYVTVTHFPSQYGTLSGIAQYNNTTVSNIQKLNPNIKNPDLIYPGQKVRVS